MLQKRLNPLLLSYFHTLEERRSTGYVFKEVLSQKTFEYKGTLKRQDRPYYLFKDRRLLNHKESKFVSIAYKVESWFYNHLPHYELIYPHLKVFFVEVLKVQNLEDYFKESQEILPYKDQLLQAFSAFRARKVKRKSYSFEFLSKSMDSLKVLNDICAICPLKKIKFTYHLVNPSPSAPAKIKEILSQYLINNSSTQYLASWE